MDVEIEEVGPCTKKVKIKVSQEDYHKHCIAAYAELNKEANLPGFRKGKVPLSMMEEKFGVEVKKDVLSQLVNDSLTTAIREKGIKALGPPTLLEIHGDEGKDIQVTASVEVIPEMELKDHTGIEVTVKIIKVTDNDVEELFEEYRMRNALNIPVKDRFVQKGDYIKIDYVGTVNGKPFEGSSGKEYVLNVGGWNLVEGFDDQMIGMQFGEEKDFQLPISKNHPNPQIAGKKIDFHVQLMSIFTKKLPEANDEFAKTADPGNPYESLKAMKLAMRDTLEERARRGALKGAKENLAFQLAELNPVIIPEKLIQEQIRFILAKEEQLRASKNPQDKSATDANKTVGDNPEEIVITPEQDKKHRSRSEKLLQQEFVLGKIADERDIKVTDEEIDREIKNFAVTMGRNNPQRMKKEMEKTGSLLRLESRMRREKTLAKIWEEIKKKEEFVDREKIMPDN
ncbi:MAG: trigger factor [Nitrospinales bacterium]